MAPFVPAIPWNPEASVVGGAAGAGRPTGAALLRAGLVLLLTLPLVVPLLRPGWIQSHEGLSYPIRQVEVARAWAEDLVTGYGVDPAAELSWTPTEPGSGPVIVRGISLASVCIHHLLPFFGQAHVAYLPQARLAGLSKLGRVVDAHARRLQTQEHLGDAIVRTLREGLEPRGVLVLLDACHSGGVVKDTKGTLPPDIEGVRKALAAAGTGVIVLSSSTKQELSREHLDWKNGAFTEAVLEALKGEADANGDGWLSVGELEEYVVTGYVS